MTLDISKKQHHGRIGASTLADVARRAGVASSTASYVLNNKTKSVGTEARERIWRAAQELEYLPNTAARALATRRTNIIGVWVPDAASAFFARVIAEVQRQARKDGYEVLISEFQQQETEPRSPQASGPPIVSVVMPQWNIDGGIAFLGSACRYIPSGSAARSTAPLVSMGAYPIEDTDFVGVQLYSGVSQAMQHLLQTGRRKIAFLAPRAACFPGDDRRDAYLTALETAGKEPRMILSEQNSRASALLAVQDALPTLADVDALMCYNDEGAIGAYCALRRAGRRIPEEIAMIGCDGISDVEYLDIPLSTIALPMEDMCATAWQFLRKRLQEPDYPTQTRMYDGGLILRQSG
jgi:DNA-binding LacI/PurR family transcriptional regulator